MESVYIYIYIITAAMIQVEMDKKQKAFPSMSWYQLLCFIDYFPLTAQLKEWLFMFMLRDYNGNTDLYTYSTAARGNAIIPYAFIY